MLFEIPKKLTLGAQTIDVKLVDLVSGTTGLDGEARYSNQSIEIRKGMKKEYSEFVFFHELVHHILSQTGDDALRTDEKFVNRFSTFLHQAIKTMK
jgi:Zn-dependent peptidase ImmA (M78 family)